MCIFQYFTLSVMWLQWMKIDELFERERTIRAAMANRAGLLSLLLHKTVDHEALQAQAAKAMTPVKPDIHTQGPRPTVMPKAGRDLSQQLAAGNEEGIPLTVSSLSPHHNMDSTEQRAEPLIPQVVTSLHSSPTTSFTTTTSNSVTKPRLVIQSVSNTSNSLNPSRMSSQIVTGSVLPAGRTAILPPNTEKKLVVTTSMPSSNRVVVTAANGTRVQLKGAALISSASQSDVKILPSTLRPLQTRMVIQSPTQSTTRPLAPRIITTPGANPLPNRNIKAVSATISISKSAPSSAALPSQIVSSSASVSKVTSPALQLIRSATPAANPSSSSSKVVDPKQLIGKVVSQSSTGKLLVSGSNVPIIVTLRQPSQDEQLKQTTSVSPAAAHRQSSVTSIEQLAAAVSKPAMAATQAAVSSNQSIEHNYTTKS